MKQVQVAIVGGGLSGLYAAATRGFASFTTQSNQPTQGAQYEIEK
jgi:monoamine oxidase